MSRFSPSGNRLSISCLVIVLFSVLTVLSHSMYLLCLHPDGSVGLKTVDVELMGSQSGADSAEVSRMGHHASCYDLPLTFGHEILGEVPHLVAPNFLLIIFSLIALSLAFSRFVFSFQKDSLPVFISASDFESSPYSLQVVSSTVFLI